VVRSFRAAVSIPLVLLGWLLAGCASVAGSIRVDTRRADPLLVMPNTTFGGFVRLRLDRVSLPCRTVTISLKFPKEPKLETRADSTDSTTIELRKSYWHDGFQLPGKVVASLDSAHAGDILALSDLDDVLYQALLKNVDRCSLDDATARIAAGELRRELPQSYSAVLQNAYNHLRWPANDLTTWVSVDLQPGMRLRIESSLPISPDGIDSNDTHPSSFSAPTYLYVSAVSSRQFCDVLKPVELEESPFRTVCAPKRNEVFVSLTAPLLRLGLHGFSEGMPPGLSEYSASGLIDLQERATTDISKFAWSYLRLWIPSKRATQRTKGPFDGVSSSGSKEKPFSAPVLVSAASSQELGCIGSRKTCGGGGGALTTPCEQLIPSRRCQALRYRVVPIPEIMITVNGAVTWLPIGSALHDVLANLMQDDVWAASDAGTSDRSCLAKRKLLQSVEVRRRYRGSLRPVEPLTLDCSRGVDAFLQLQLLAGDEIRWN
jgi:hypothetical protein